jgi:hypothetical protein
VDKKGEKYAREWAKERWLDMGMGTVIFTVHTDRQGQLVVDVCVAGPVILASLN